MLVYVVTFLTQSVDIGIYQDVMLIIFGVNVIELRTFIYCLLAMTVFVALLH